MLKHLGNKILSSLGYRIINDFEMPFDLDDEFISVFQKCKMYTMTSVERMYALYQAVKYVTAANIPGDFVECGVWKGGSSMLAATTLLHLGQTQRKLYLYDTFEGMSKPTDVDVSIRDSQPAWETWKKSMSKEYNQWCYASLEEVVANLRSTQYPAESLFFVKGKVEDTIPETIPEQIALLRLDTDWYESTYHELKMLLPKLARNGVLIVDDYGYWKGAREAVDRYFEESGIHLLLCRIDETGRIAINLKE